jgi:translation initiation factor IF-2
MGYIDDVIRETAKSWSEQSTRPASSAASVEQAVAERAAAEAERVRAERLQAAQRRAREEAQAKAAAAEAAEAAAINARRAAARAAAARAAQDTSQHHVDVPDDLRAPVAAVARVWTPPAPDSLSAPVRDRVAAPSDPVAALRLRLCQPHAMRDLVIAQAILSRPPGLSRMPGRRGR